MADPSTLSRRLGATPSSPARRCCRTLATVPALPPLLAGGSLPVGQSRCRRDMARNPHTWCAHSSPSLLPTTSHPPSPQSLLPLRSPQPLDLGVCLSGRQRLSGPEAVGAAPLAWVVGKTAAVNPALLTEPAGGGGLTRLSTYTIETWVWVGFLSCQLRVMIVLIYHRYSFYCWGYFLLFTTIEELVSEINPFLEKDFYSRNPPVPRATSLNGLGSNFPKHPFSVNNLRRLRPSR